MRAYACAIFFYILSKFGDFIHNRKNKFGDFIHFSQKKFGDN